MVVCLLSVSAATRRRGGGSGHRLLLPADLAAAEARAAEAETRASAAEATIAQLRLLIEKLRRELYGRRSERKAALIEQLALELEELQASATEDELQAEAAVTATGTQQVQGVFNPKPPPPAQQRNSGRAYLIGILDLVEVLVDDLKEGLLLVTARGYYHPQLAKEDHSEPVGENDLRTSLPSILKFCSASDTRRSRSGPVTSIAPSGISISVTTWLGSSSIATGGASGWQVARATISPFLL
jgi:hypothetical protein